MSENQLIATRVPDNIKQLIEDERLTREYGMSEYLRDLVEADMAEESEPKDEHDKEGFLAAKARETLNKTDSDSEDDILRIPIDSWEQVRFVMSGTDDSVTGDGLTLEATSLCPGENAVLEVVVDGEKRALFLEQ